MTLVLLLVYCNYFNVLCGVSAERFCKVTDIVSFPQIFQELFSLPGRAAAAAGLFPKSECKGSGFFRTHQIF